MAAAISVACGAGGVQFGATKVPYADACGTAADSKCKVFSRDTPALVLLSKRTIVPTQDGKEQWETFLGGVYGVSETTGQVPARCADVALVSTGTAEVNAENPFTFEISSSDLVEANLTAGLGDSLLDDAATPAAAGTPAAAAAPAAAATATDDGKKFAASFQASLKSTGTTKVKLSGTYVEVAIPASVQQDLLAFDVNNIKDAATKSCRVWLDDHKTFRLIANLSAFRIDSFELTDKAAFKAAFDAGVSAVADLDKQAKLKAKFEATIASTGTVRLGSPVTGIYSFGFMVPANHS